MKPAKTISIIELLSEYSTEHKAVKWLEKIRWDKEPICPHCGGVENISKQKSKKLLTPLTIERVRQSKFGYSLI
jgi:hypothetical protein